MKNLISEKEKIQFKDLSKHVDKEVKIECWMYNRRGSGKIMFLQLRDGSGFVQGVVEQDNVDSETWEEADKATIESSCIVTGTVVKHFKEEGKFEIRISKFEILHLAPEFPIGKKEHGPEFLFENRDLYLRSKTPWAVLRIRNQVFLSITNFFHEEGFFRTDTPVLQPTSCEDTTELFEIDYYDTPMYLTQSGQLYSEAAIMGLSKVYDFGPVFRAEKSKTRNHLSEFWMMDAEMAFYDQDMNEDLQERLVKRILSDALGFCKTELEVLERDTTVMEKTVKSDFIRMKHYEAKVELEKDGFKVDYDDDMTTEEEIALGNKYGIPVFIEDYPFEVKSFYMKSYEDERGVKRARCADLIAPEEAREIIGGSQREDDYETLKKEIIERNYPLEDYEWYLNIRKYGSVPHSGFGIGMERMVRWISGVHHIRETIPFPRTTVLKRP